MNDEFAGQHVERRVGIHWHAAEPAAELVNHKPAAIWAVSNVFIAVQRPGWASLAGNSVVG